MIDDFVRYDALGLAALVHKRETSPRELLESAIARAEAVEPRIHSLVMRFDDEARKLADGPLPEGAFRGVPFLVKDLHVMIAGRPLWNGCALFRDNVSAVDSSIMARYRAAGLVTFGRTASPEFGLTATTESRLHGQTRNPWNPEHTAGGSSGGAAAAVAAGIVPLANASDGGGSIRIPASCCGLFGLKPTRGRTPAGPLVGEGWSGMSAIHAVSRSVRDSAALLDATAGADLGAPYAAPPPERPWLDEVGRSPGSLRIALQTSTWNGMPTDEVCRAAAADAARLCESHGHRVEEARLEIDGAALVEAGLTIVTANLRATLDARAAELGRSLEESDVEPGTWLLYSLAETRTAAHYAQALRTIHAIGRKKAAFLETYDVLLTPTMAAPPPRLGVLSLSSTDLDARTAAIQRAVGFTQACNASGHPAASVPLYVDPASNLPIGTQIVARMNDEATIFRLASQLEQARPWFDRLPAIG